MKKLTLLTKENLQITLASISLFYLSYRSYKYFSNQQRIRNLQKKYDDDLILQVLMSFQKNLYPVFYYINQEVFNYIQKLKQQYEFLKEGYLNSLRESLINEQKSILNQGVKKVEEIVYEKFKIENQKEFEQWCLERSKENFGILSVILKIRETFQKVIQGEGLVNEYTYNFTPQDIFEMNKKFLIQLMQIMKKQYLLQQQQQKSSKTIIEQIVSIDYDKFINSEEELFDHPLKIIHSGIEYFKENSFNFNERNNQIEKMKNQLMKMIQQKKNILQINLKIEQIEKAKYLEEQEKELSDQDLEEEEESFSFSESDQFM